MRRHSKLSIYVPFSRSLYEAEQRKLRRAFETEIACAVDWVDRHCPELSEGQSHPNEREC